MILSPSRFWQPPRGASTCAGTAFVRRGRSSERGQALAEFALLVPLMLLLAVALGDFGRLFNAAIAVESAAREAADYGAMQGKLKWDSSVPAQITQNEADMQTRACTAASTLSDYAGDPPGTVGMTCTNPSFSYDIEAPTGFSGNCSNQAEFDNPCVIHVTMTYDFHMFLNFPPLISIFHMTRESRFAVSDLGQ
jgi:Flp pilus assembly protein TadG